jgi:hypothetical protein
VTWQAAVEPILNSDAATTGSPAPPLYTLHSGAFDPQFLVREARGKFDRAQCTVCCMIVNVNTETMRANMKIRRIANLAILSFALLIALVTVAHANDKVVPGWDPTVFRDASTIKVMTTQPDVGEHWSSLSVVVIDGQPYIRLRDRSYGRIQRNTTRPYVKLKVVDQEFDKVKVEEMLDMKEKVAAAMADKYWMDILIRHESHPMVARLVLVPEASPPQKSSH